MENANHASKMKITHGAIVMCVGSLYIQKLPITQRRILKPSQISLMDDKHL